VQADAVFGVGPPIYVRVASPFDGRIVGLGPVVVVIAGGPGAAGDFLQGFEELTDSGFRVVTYDQRGVGRSASPQDDQAFRPSACKTTWPILSGSGSGSA
jgi:pimeloyl-ACP methyl ester carboxylesterase